MVAITSTQASHLRHGPSSCAPSQLFKWQEVISSSCLRQCMALVLHHLHPSFLQHQHHRFPHHALRRVLHFGFTHPPLLHLFDMEGCAGAVIDKICQHQILLGPLQLKLMLQGRMMLFLFFKGDGDGTIGRVDAGAVDRDR